MLQHRPRIYAWPWMERWTTDISMAPDCIRTLGPHMALGGCMDHGTSTWPQVAAQAIHIDMATRGSKSEDISKASISNTNNTNHTCSSGSQASSGPEATAWTTDTKMTCPGTIYYHGHLRSSNLESETFFIAGAYC